MQRLRDDIGRERQQYSEKTLTLCPFVHHRFHMEWSLFDHNDHCMAMARNARMFLVMRPVVLV